jgi:hypothetical protein
MDETEEEGETINRIPQEIVIYIDPEGDVTISSLFADLLPLAYSLDESDGYIRGLMEAQRKLQGEDHPEKQ